MTKGILILPANATKLNIRFANIKLYCFCSCWMPMAAIILTAFVTGIRKKINCCRFTATAWKMILTDKFEFTYKDGKPFLKVLDSSIKRVAAGTTAARPAEAFIVPDLPAEEVAVEEQPAKRLGIVFNFNANHVSIF